MTSIEEWNFPTEGVFPFPRPRRETATKSGRKPDEIYTVVTRRPVKCASDQMTFHDDAALNGLLMVGTTEACDLTAMTERRANAFRLYLPIDAERACLPAACCFALYTPATSVLLSTPLVDNV